MKIFTVVIVCMISAISVFAQNQAPLNEKLSEMFKQNFADWQASNTDKVFYPMIKHTWKFNPETQKSDEVTNLQSIWTKRNKKVQILMEPATAERRETFIRTFAIRNISPPSYKIDDLGDEAILIKFHNRVEIAFIKENIATRINYDYPSKYKKSVSYNSAKMYDAPKEEVEFALKIARSIADEIKAKQTIETLTGVQQ